MSDNESKTDKSPQKTAIVTDAWFPQINGVVRTLDTIKKQLEERGHQMVMITPEQFHTRPLPGYEEIELANPLRVKKGERSVWRTLNEEKPDNLYIATVEGPLGFFAWAHSVATRTPFTAGYHTRFPEYVSNYVEKFGEKRILPKVIADPLAAAVGSASHVAGRILYNRADAVLVPTLTVQNELQDMGYKNTVLWTRGVDTELFSPNYDVHPDLKDLPRPILLNVGRVSSEKNIEDFLDADVPGTKVLVGGGPELGYFQQKYADKPNILFMGMKKGEELSQIYASADVFVFPSKTDTFGNVMLEAMASGVPVAAYEIPSPVDVIRDPKAGVLAKEVSLEGLSEAIGQALKLDGKDARRYVEREYTWEKATDIFEQNLPAYRDPKMGVTPT